MTDTCKTPGCDKPVKRRSDGRSMGYCEECWPKVISRGKRKAKKEAEPQATAPPAMHQGGLVDHAPKHGGVLSPDEQRVILREGSGYALDPAPDPRAPGAAMLGRFVQEQSEIYFAAERWSCSKKSSANQLARLVRALGEGGYIIGWQPEKGQETA